MTHAEIMLLILAAGFFIYFVWRKVSGSRYVRRMLSWGAKRKIQELIVGSKQSCCS